MLNSISELIKNALDAGANTIFFGFIYIDTDIACIVKDDGVKHIEQRFLELGAGTPMKYRHLLSGASIIKSDKSLTDLGKHGRGLAEINEFLEKCGGYLLVAKSSKGGAKIKLVAPKNAHTPNIEEIKLDYGSYCGSGDEQTVLHHQQVAQRMSVEPPKPFLSHTAFSPVSSAVSPNSVTEEKTADPEVKTNASYALPDERPAPPLISDSVFRDEKENARIIQMYRSNPNLNQTIKISASGKIKHRIFYDQAGTPLRHVKYYKEGPIKGHLQLNLESAPEGLSLPYSNTRSITFFKRTEATKELVVSKCSYFNDDAKNSLVLSPLASQRP